MGKIYYNSSIMDTSISNIQESLTEIDTILNEFKTARDNLEPAWEGESATAVIGKMDETISLIPTINEKTKAYIDFLNGIKTAYPTLDKDLTIK